jgi:hypothetical protein
VTAGYSGTPLGRKLGIRDGALVALLPGSNVHARRVGDVLALEVDAGVRLRTDLRARGPHDVIVVFVRSEAELKRRFGQARRRLAEDGGLWVAWPKGSSTLATGLRESHVRAWGLSAGLVDNKVCAIDEDWSGLRFVVRVADRRKA